MPPPVVTSAPVGIVLPPPLVTSAPVGDILPPPDVVTQAPIGVVLPPPLIEEGSEKLSGNRAVVIPRYGVRYTLEEEATPARSDYIELKRLTDAFLKNFMEQRFIKTDRTVLVEFATQYSSSSITAEGPILVTYESKAVFSVLSSVVPSADGLDELLVQAFLGESLMEYVTNLQEMQASNDFSMTVGVEFTREIPDETRVVRSSSDFSAVAAIAAGSVGILVLSLSLFAAKRRYDSTLEEKKEGRKSSNLTGMTFGAATFSETNSSDDTSFSQLWKREHSIDEEEGLIQSLSKGNNQFSDYDDLDNVSVESERHREECFDESSSITRSDISSGIFRVDRAQSFESSESFPSLDEMSESTRSCDKNHETSSEEDSQGSSSTCDGSIDHEENVTKDKNKLLSLVSEKEKKLHPWEGRAVRKSSGAHSEDTSLTVTVPEESGENETTAFYKTRSARVDPNEDTASEIASTAELVSEDEESGDDDSDFSQKSSGWTTDRKEELRAEEQPNKTKEEDEEEKEELVKAHEQKQQEEQKKLEADRAALEERVKVEMQARLEEMTAEQARLKAQEAALIAERKCFEEEKRLNAAREAFEARLRKEEETRLAEKKRLEQEREEFEARNEKERLERLAIEILLNTERDASAQALKAAKTELQIAQQKRIDEERKLEVSRAEMKARAKGDEEEHLLRNEEFVRQNEKVEEEEKIVTEVVRDAKFELEKEKGTLKMRIKAEERAQEEQKQHDKKRFMLLEEETPLVIPRETFESRIDLKEKTENLKIGMKENNKEETTDESSESQKRLEHNKILEPKGGSGSKPKSQEGEANDKESFDPARSFLTSTPELMTKNGSINEQGCNLGGKERNSTKNQEIPQDGETAFYGVKKQIAECKNYANEDGSKGNQSWYRLGNRPGASPTRKTENGQSRGHAEHAFAPAPFISPFSDDSSDNDELGDGYRKEEITQELIRRKKDGKRQVRISETKELDTEIGGTEGNHNQVMPIASRNRRRYQSGTEDCDTPWWHDDNEDKNDNEANNKKPSISRRPRVTVERRSSRSFRSYSTREDSDDDSEDGSDASGDQSESYGSFSSQSEYSSRSRSSSGYFQSILPR